MQVESCQYRIYGLYCIVSYDLETIFLLMVPKIAFCFAATLHCHIQFATNYYYFKIFSITTITVPGIHKLFSYTQFLFLT